jgi:hypothetical protein
MSSQPFNNKDCPNFWGAAYRLGLMSDQALSSGKDGIKFTTSMLQLRGCSAQCKPGTAVTRAPSRSHMQIADLSTANLMNKDEHATPVRT